MAHDLDIAVHFGVITLAPKGTSKLDLRVAPVLGHSGARNQLLSGKLNFPSSNGETMKMESSRKVADRNPRTIEEAHAFVTYVESLFMPWNVEGLLAGFTEDCIVRYAEFPEMRGKRELGNFFRSRTARQLDFDIQKTFRMLMNDTIANSWSCTWTDSQSNKRMWGKGLEIWTMRDGKIAIWEGAFNFNEEGKRNTGIV